jgi:exosortase A-associated hydrolase 1
MSSAGERGVVFNCGGELLIGVLHEPVERTSSTGILIVVGGPQYRVGSHRQFVLLARALAGCGHAVLRFDYRGMGDSDGDNRGFEHVDTDIRAAVDVLLAGQSALEGVVIWGLCDAASAVLMYCAGDRRVVGVILANPWVRTETGEARAYLRHYYLQRLLQPTFWRKVIGGRFNPVNSVVELAYTLLHAGRGRPNVSAPAASFVGRMLAGLASFGRPVLVLISERDLTARAFVDLYSADRGWRAAMSSPHVTVVRLLNADHTFSSRDALNQAAAHCSAWLAKSFSFRRATPWVSEQ